MQSQVQLLQAIQGLVSPLTYRTSLPSIAEDDLWDCWEIWKRHDVGRNVSTQAINQAWPCKSAAYICTALPMENVWRQMGKKSVDAEKGVNMFWNSTDLWVVWRVCSISDRTVNPVRLRWWRLKYKGTTHHNMSQEQVKQRNCFRSVKYFTKEDEACCQ